MISSTHRRLEKFLPGLFKLTRLRIFFFGLIFMTATSLQLLLFANPRVSPDGWIYLSSGVSVFRGTMATDYYFVRDPLYPIFVAATHHFDSSLFLLMIIQGLILALSLWLVFIQALLFRSPKPYLVRRFDAFILGLGLIFTWLYVGGYSSLVLQQSLLASGACLSGAFLFEYLRKARESGGTLRPLFGIALVGFFGSLVSITFISVVATSFLIVVAMELRRGRSRKIFVSVSMTVLLLGLSASGALVWQSISLSIQSSQDSISEEVSQDPHSGGSTLSSIISRIQGSPPYPQIVLVSFLANLDLAPTQGWWLEGLYRYENPFYTNGELGIIPLWGGNQLCLGEVPESPFVNPTYTGSTIGQCFSPPIGFVPFGEHLKHLLQGGGLVFGFVGWCLLALTSLVSLTRKQSIPITIWVAPAYVYVLLYSLATAGLGRYGVVVYPLIVIHALIFALQSLASKKVRWEDG